MKKRSILLGLVCLIGLSGCYGTKKVDYKTFAEEVAKTILEKQPTIAKQKVKGWKKYDEGKERASYTVTYPDSIASSPTYKGTNTEMHSEVSAYIYAYSTASIIKSDSATYYIENGFRVVDGKNTFSWDEHFNLTKIKIDGECSFTIRYTYKD